MLSIAMHRSQRSMCRGAGGDLISQRASTTLSQQGSAVVYKDC